MILSQFFSQNFPLLYLILIANPQSPPPPPRSTILSRFLPLSSFFFLLSPPPFSRQTSLLLKTSTLRKFLPPSSEITLCLFKNLLFFLCMENPRSLFWELLLLPILPKPINPYIFSFLSRYSFIIYVNEITSKSCKIIIKKRILFPNILPYVK